jgi:hypothetical protein
MQMAECFCEFEYSPLRAARLAKRMSLAKSARYDERLPGGQANKRESKRRVHEVQIEGQAPGPGGDKVRPVASIAQGKASFSSRIASTPISPSVTPGFVARHMTGCGSRGHLENQRPKRRSQLRPDTTASKAIGCGMHDGPAIHRGTVEVQGTAPDGLIRRAGVQKDGAAVLTIGPGERILEEDGKPGYPSFLRMLGG